MKLLAYQTVDENPKQNLIAVLRSWWRKKMHQPGHSLASYRKSDDVEILTFVMATMRDLSEVAGNVREIKFFARNSHLSRFVFLPFLAYFRFFCLFIRKNFPD
jgi:hypothetical protein